VVLRRLAGLLEHGNSVGLWLVNWLVTEMGGSVDVTVEDGTTVTVALQQGPGEDTPRSGGVGQAALGDDPESRSW
jgi:hypothetical protein